MAELKECPECKSKIPCEATRCKHCTAEVEPEYVYLSIPGARITSQTTTLLGHPRPTDQIASATIGVESKPIALVFTVGSFLFTLVYLAWAWWEKGNAEAALTCAGLATVPAVVAGVIGYQRRLLYHIAIEMKDGTTTRAYFHRKKRHIEAVHAGLEIARGEVARLKVMKAEE